MAAGETLQNRLVAMRLQRKTGKPTELKGLIQDRLQHALYAFRQPDA